MPAVVVAAPGRSQSGSFQSGKTLIGYRTGCKYILKHDPIVTCSRNCTSSPVRPLANRTPLDYSTANCATIGMQGDNTRRRRRLNQDERGLAMATARLRTPRLSLGAVVLGVTMLCVVPGLGTTTAVAAGTTLNAKQLGTVKQQLTEALKNINPALSGQARIQAITLAIQTIASNVMAQFGTDALATMAAAAASVVPPAVAVPAVLSAAVSSGVAVPIAVAQITAGAVEGGTSPTVVAQTVIAAGAQQNLPTSEVGAGLGVAAATVAQSSPTAAVQISTTIANEAPSDMTQSYATSVVASGGSTQLADKSVQPPSAIVGGTANNANNVTLPASQPPGTQSGATSAGGTGSTQALTGNPSVGTSNAALPPCNNPSCT